MPVGEHDRRVVLLTKERGKIAAFARGARKQNSSLLAKCQPFVTGEFTIYPGRDAYTIVQAEAEEYFSQIREDLEMVCYGCYFCEFVGYFARENLEAGDLLNLLYITLSTLIKKKFSYSLLRSIFECKVLALEGEAPWIFDCMSCHFKGKDQWFFYSKGGLLCKTCIQKMGKKILDSDSILMEESVQYTLAYIINSPLNRLYSFQLTNTAAEKFFKFVHTYIKRTVVHEFKSLSMLNLDERKKVDSL